MRIVLFTMAGPMALPVLQCLLAQPVKVIGLVQPAPPGTPILTALPPAASPPKQEVVTPTSVATLADRAGIPRFAVRRVGLSTLVEHSTFQQADLAIVVCWPWRIPSHLLTTPQLGWLNVHPSPLPELRGPEPLFWALRLGWTKTAITLHLMDEEFDHGPIVQQMWFELPLGERLSTIEALVGHHAVQLLPLALAKLTTLDWHPQSQPTSGSYYPVPSPVDFTFTADWSVQRAYAFVRAIAEWNHPFTFVAPHGQTTTITDAIGFQIGEQLATSIVPHGKYLFLQLYDGTLIARP